MSAEIKVVISLKDNRGIIGISAPDCDPMFSVHEGDLQCMLEMVPAMVEEAKRKWDSNPRYPKADVPKPPPQPSQVSSSPAKRTAQPQQTQPTMF